MRTVKTIDIAPRTGRSVSPFDLQRYAAGELSAERRNEIAGLLDAEPALADELVALEAERRSFNVEHPFARLEAKLDAEATSSTSFFGRIAAMLSRPQVFAPVATAACALAFVVFSPGTMNPGDDGTREKGGQHLGVMLDDGGEARALNEGAMLREGDRIQFVLRDPADAALRVIVGIDGRRDVTLYDARPLRQKASARAEAFDDSLILDDAAGPERFFVVYATAGGEPKAFAERVMTAARNLASSGADLAKTERLDVRADVQSSFFIIKQARP